MRPPRLVLKQATNLLYYRDYTTISLSSKTTWGGTHVQFHSVCSKRPALPKQYCKPERKGKTLNKTRGGYIHVENCELKSLPGFICPVELSQRGSCLISVYDTRKDTLGVCFSFALSLPPRRRRLLFTWHVSSIGIFSSFSFKFYSPSGLSELVSVTDFEI